MLATQLAVRRLVVVDEGQYSRVICDGPSPDIRTDPARPGYACARIWVSDRTPARIAGVRDTLSLPNVLQPPAAGSVCNVVTFPPDESYGSVSADKVLAFFDAMAAPGLYAPAARISICNRVARWISVSSLRAKSHWFSIRRK